MKFVAISDTHNYNEKIAVPNGDVLIHCGDLTSVGTSQEIEDALNWLASLPHTHKILVSGNHDFFAMDLEGDFRSFCEDRQITYLNNELIKIEGIRIWGSPMTPTFGDWAFMDSEKNLSKIFAEIPTNLDILITHGPPRGILDSVRHPTVIQYAGSSTLLESVKKAKPRYHIFGHIHEHGCEIQKTADTTFINVSVLDPSYRPWKKPLITFDVSSNI